MRTELGESPVAFRINRVGDMAHITFFENAAQLPSEDAPRWQADIYTLVVPYRPGLTASIEANYQAWMDRAKAQEEAAPPPTIEERVGVVEETVTLIAEVLL